MKKLPLIISALLITSALFAEDEVTVKFHNFSWGTSMEAFKARMGNPAHEEELNGFRSLIYENVPLAGHRAFLIAYFSGSGLEGGAYYFNTNNLEEQMRCYTAVLNDLVLQFGHPPSPMGRYETLLRELRPYESCWNLPSGYVHLKVNTRSSDPVTLWISFPALTEILDS